MLIQTHHNDGSHPVHADVTHSRFVQNAMLIGPPPRTKFSAIRGAVLEIGMKIWFAREHVQM